MHAHAIVAVVLATCAACAPMPKHPIAIAVLVDGDRPPLPERGVPGLALQPFALAPEPAAAADPTTTVLAAARKAYATGSHDGCRTEIAKLDIAALLAAGQRNAVARALALDTGCAYQGLAQDDAARVADRLAAFGLDLPADAIAREAEELIVAALAKSSAAPRAKLAVTGETGARVSVDGKAAMCTVPCPLELAPGEHVIAVDTDAFEPAWKVVRIPDVTTLAIPQQPATAIRASSQWRARIGRGQPATDATGASLIALAAGQPRVAYVHADADRALKGSLIVDGKLRASGSDTDGPRLLRELAYDGGLLQRPKLYQRPWFWIAVTGFTLAASGAIVYVTYEPEIRTMVSF